MPSLVANLTALAQSVAKPRNDSFDSGAQTIWRASEDRMRLCHTGDDGLLAAVSDGAGASGLFCGPWAETLLENLPQSPLTGPNQLDAWLEGFCLDFRAQQLGRVGDARRHAKFVREGSCATLTACWLSPQAGGVVLNWLAYGDSPLLVFDRSGGGYELVECQPGTLAAMDRDPHLLNWKDVPHPLAVRAGRMTLPRQACVVLASDAVGQFLLLRWLALESHQGSQGSDCGLREESRRMAEAGTTRMAQALRRHLETTSPDGFAAKMDSLRQALLSEQSFAQLMGLRCEQGLLANDDATLILIDIDVEPDSSLPTDAAPVENTP